jgi:hypothetical protein
VVEIVSGHDGNNNYVEATRTIVLAIDPHALRAKIVSSSQRIKTHFE